MANHVIYDDLDDIGLNHMYKEIDSSLDKLLKELNNEIDMRNIKEIMLNITQLYFDGIIATPSDDTDVLSKQKETLDSIMEGLNMIIPADYEENEIILDDTKEYFLKNSDVLSQYGSRNPPKYRHLIGRRDAVIRYCKFLKKLKCRDTLPDLDSIVSIASGGFEPGIIASHLLDVDNMLLVRYSNICKFDIDVKIPKCIGKEYYSDNIKDSNVMIVDDILDQGRTLDKTIRWALEFKPERLYCSVVNDSWRGFNILKKKKGLPSKKIASGKGYMIKATLYEINIKKINKKSLLSELLNG